MMITKSESLYSKRTKAKRWSVSEIDELEISKRKLLISGSGRSGTKFTAKLLKKLGQKVDHERVDDYGTVSWYFCIQDAEWYPYHPWDPRRVHSGERGQHYEFETILHQTRHPLKAIASMMKVHQVIDYEWAYEHGLIRSMDDKPLVKAMSLWSSANFAIEERAHWQYRMEDLVAGSVWDEWLDRCGLPQQPMPVMKPANRATGYRTPEKLTRQDLMDANPVTALAIIGQAARYGYQL